MSNVFLFILTVLISSPSVLFAEDKLIFAVDIIRHGDRTPISALPTINYHWKEGPGQLTAIGMEQEYKLGLAFRKKYIEQSHLLPEHYEPGTMMVRSTFYDRTLMSAQSLLMGLYPAGTGPNTSDSSLPALPHAFQPIPIFSAPSNLDEVIVQPVSQVERRKLDEQYVYPTPEWQQYNESLKEKYPLWSKLLGIPVTTIAGLQGAADILFIHQLHHAPLPEGLSDEDVNTIIKAGQWAFMAHEKPQQTGVAYSGKLMSHIADYLNTGSLKQSKLKYVLLSAHDVTISTVLSFLGAPLEMPPPYASNVNFSLYENGANDYIVKITFNGKPVVVPACGGSRCQLQQFITMVNETKTRL